MLKRYHGPKKRCDHCKFYIARLINESNKYLCWRCVGLPVPSVLPDNYLPEYTPSDLYYPEIQPWICVLGLIFFFIAIAHIYMGS